MKTHQNIHQIPETPEIPEISTKTNLTLAQAKKEYIWLAEVLKHPERFGCKHGFAQSLEGKLYDRQHYLQAIIADFVCKL